MIHAQRADRIKPSATLSITAKANELNEQGIDVVNFGAGEPDFPTPEPVKEAGHQAIRDNFTRYTAASGHPDLKQAVVDRLERDYGVVFEPGRVSVGCGAKHVLFNLFASLLNQDDEVIVFSPYWVSYPNQIRFFGGRTEVVPTEDTDFQPDLDRVRNAVTDRTKAILLNSPSNPSGAVISRKNLRGLADLAGEHDLLLISDEIYGTLTYGDRRHHSALSLDPAVRDRTVLVDGVSKSHAMTGWRIGYAVGPEPVIGNMNKLMSHSTSNPSSISQRAAIRALRMPAEELADRKQAFKERRDRIVQRLNDLPGVSCSTPGGAFYAFPDVRELIADHPDVSDDMELAERLIEEAHIAVVPGSPFGAPGFLRLSYATGLDRIETGLDRFGDWIG